jgi:hypothetical protein
LEAGVLLFGVTALMGALLAFNPTAAWAKFWVLIGGLGLFGGFAWTPARVRFGSRAFDPVRWTLALLPAALVAMKLVSIPNRMGHREAKRSSDCYDLYRLCLLDSARTPIADALASAPEELAVACRARLQRYLLDDAERSAGWIRQGATFMATLTADDLRAVGAPLIRRFDAAAREA